MTQERTTRNPSIIVRAKGRGLDRHQLIAMVSRALARNGKNSDVVMGFIAECNGYQTLEQVEQACGEWVTLV